MDFGRRLRTLRMRRGFAQEKLALAAGLDKNYVTEAERGKSNPTLQTLCRLADALGVDYLALLDEDALDVALSSMAETTEG